MQVFKEENICAISSPAGVGAIAIIRINGNNCFSICENIIKNKIYFQNLKHKKMLFCQIIDKNGNLIDDVLAVKFFSPHSFTGENMVEIYCHASIYIQNTILQLLVENGCRIATKGEFSKIAFLNGKMDLSQAEAVADLISSKNFASHKQAVSQMRGAYKNELQDLRNKLLNFASLIELELDFSDEDLEFADRSNLLLLINVINDKLSKLLLSFKVGNVIKNGIPVAIVGKTNVGKSSLLNYFLKEDKAIVSNIHGTTRDAIEDCIDIEGISFRFIDTAGLRKTDNIIENMGIEKSYEKIQISEIILFVIDASDDSSDITSFISQQITNVPSDKKIIFLFNKIDLLSQDQIIELNSLPILKNKIFYFISVKNNNLDNLYKKLRELALSIQETDSNVIVTNIRHYEALYKANKSSENIKIALQNKISCDFLAQDIRECLNYLAEITGEITNDEILSNIFKNFCIGK